MTKTVRFLQGLGLAAVLLSLGPASPRIAAAAPDSMPGYLVTWHAAA